MISHWIIPISGYTQSRDQRTGLSELWRKLHEKFTSSEICIQPVLPWDHNWRRLARFISINSYANPRLKAKICIIGYSWGGGWGAQKLAEQLRIEGLEVNRMVLADPVYRSDKLLCRWRTLLRRGGAGSCFVPSISIPSNVLHVQSTRQANNWPQAHKLEPDSETTRIDKAVKDLDRNHNQMDESPIFKEMATNAVIELIQGAEL